MASTRRLIVLGLAVLAFLLLVTAVQYAPSMAEQFRVVGHCGSGSACAVGFLCCGGVCDVAEACAASRAGPGGPPSASVRAPSEGAHEPTLSPTVASSTPTPTLAASTPTPTPTAAGAQPQQRCCVVPC